LIPNIQSIESVEAVSIEYKDIETYFDKDKIYTKLGLNFEPEKLLMKFAAGTGRNSGLSGIENSGK